MPITIDIKPQQLISLPTGLHRFVKEKRNCVLLLERLGTGFELPLPEYKLIDMLGKGTAKIIDITEDQTAEEARQGPDLDNGDPSKRRPGPADNADFGPGEAWQEGDDPEQAKLMPEGRRALALQFYTQKWDATKNGSLGEIGLQALITANRISVQRRPDASLCRTVQQSSKPTRPPLQARRHPQAGGVRVSTCASPYRPEDRFLQAGRRQPGGADGAAGISDGFYFGKGEDSPDGLPVRDGGRSDLPGSARDLLLGRAGHALQQFRDALVGCRCNKVRSHGTL